MAVTRSESVPPQPARPVGASPAAGTAAERRRDRLALVGLVLLSVAAFANSLTNGFVRDDVVIIRDNPRLDHPGDWAAIFGTSYWGPLHLGTNLYRPLTILSFAVDRALLSHAPFGVHLVNVLGNALLVVLLYLFLRKLLARRNVAFLAAALFAVHPLHTEVVASGVGRADIFAALAATGALLLHLEYVARRRGLQPRLGRQFPADFLLLGGALLLFFISLLFKESTIALPAVVLLMEWLVASREQRAWLRGSWRRVTLYAIPLVIYGTLRLAVVGAAPPIPHEIMRGASELQVRLHAAETVMRYLAHALVPWPLCGEYADYLHPPRPSLADPLTIAALLHFAAVGALCVWLYRTRRLVPLFGLAFFYFTILPVSNLIVPVGTIRADRLAFWPALGVTLCLAWLLGELAASHRRAAGALASVLLLTYAGLSIARNPVWRSDETWGASTVRQNPGSPFAWHLLAEAYAERGADDLAAPACERAIALRDRLGFCYPEARLGYGELLVRRGDPAGAAAHFRVAADYYRQARTDPNDFGTLLNLGALLADDPASRDEALELLRRAVAANPRDFRGHANLAVVYAAAGEWDRAAACLDEALRLRPDVASLRRDRDEVRARLAARAASRPASRPDTP